MEKLFYFLRTSLRHLLMHKKFTFINIVGLSIGLTISLLILLFVRYETSYDNFNPNAGNIYRIVERNIQDGSIGVQTPLALSDVLKKDFPEINQVFGLMRFFEKITVNEESFEKLNGAIIEKDFFETFGLPLQSGKKGTVFNDPFEAVITRKMANKLFGDDNAIGKTFDLDKYTFTISGIINNIPSNSIFKFDYFLSDKFRYRYYPDLNDRWYEFGLFTFITFKGNMPPPGFEQKLNGIEKQYYPDFMKNRFKYVMTGFKSSHLNPSLEYDLVPTIEPSYLWMISTIAIGILIIACINFMNIAIAGAGKRNIETGIKKVSGATSGSLIVNFFTEIIIVVVISLALSFLGVYLLTPSFNELVEKDVVMNFLDPVLWIGIVCFCILTILISGLYPSIVLSRPSPVKVLIQNKVAVKSNFSFQKAFVILQFAITVILGITMLFIIKQVSFMQHHKVGFDKENLIAMQATSLGKDDTEQLKNVALFTQTLEKYQAQYGFSKASVTEFIPGFGYRNNFKIFPEDDPTSNGFELLSCDVDENYLEVFKQHLIEGRNFSNDIRTDMEEAILINESAFRKLGWKSIEGKYVGLFSRENRKKVVGVINDINIKSLKHSIDPMIYQFGAHHNYPGYITLRLNSAKKAESIEVIKKQWEGLFPNIPFGFESIEEKYMAAYGEEKKLSKITGIFSILAMVLSLLGIFALSTLETEKRIKEIGIRKVNGARTTEVMAMLNRDFIKWVALAFVIACPIAWYAMHKWLENFAYKTDLSWWVFAAAGLISMVIALLTVSWQSWRAATRNPVESLRYE